MDANTTQNQKGFTLVEIAIVLVIIGLLLGGVLKGQELITNSKSKSVTQDLEGVVTAYYAYQDRTGRVPGDTVTPFDGKIDKAEVADGFWSLLRKEGFIKGASTDHSGVSHALGGTFTVLPGAGTGAMFTKNHICASAIDPAIAQGMDHKLDDGVPTTGIVKSGTVITTPLSTAYTGTADVFVCREF